MLDKVLETCKFVVTNANHVKINYDKADMLIKELLEFENIHYLTKVPYDIYNMPTKDIINFLLIYDSIDFSFWGNPKWTIIVNNEELDGGIALLDCIFNLFSGRNSEEVYKEIESMSLEDFSLLLKGNIDIPLLEERYIIINKIAKIVNKKMNGSFYSAIKNMKSDKEIFELILTNFSSFEDTRNYNGQPIYFYKLAQLLTSDVLHVLENKEQIIVDYSNLVGCADYKIPQVMESYGILEYDELLENIIRNKVEIEENSPYEIEIRASMIMVINYMYLKNNKKIKRIDINDFIWGKGQNKNIRCKPYHLTRTTSY